MKNQMRQLLQTSSARVDFEMYHCCGALSLVPLHRLAQIMGHDSLDTTRVYVQGTKHDLQQAVETIAWT
jgi:hypothetical protein